ncbi:ATP-binding protein [Flammeovirga aprica]|uniref:AAA family ATPase n=1 Tax=Flammeovirga aprica JL-4 TaxID=694437 RepID=A0A7X9RZ08_9BACT|nr:ATP-binding protein [Flammeovirga aprica]NME71316.1 AAA family ATPase [Flammeovirga aprica JL-4]
MKKLPIGIQDFRQLRERNAVYIDKTGIIHQLVEESKYYFLSRPRRFGKSLLISTLNELFSGSKDLFEGLMIENQWDWSITNPVINLPFALLNYQELGLRKALIHRLTKIGKEYKVTLTATNLKELFEELILALHKQYDEVVILVDEYDKPIIDYIGTELDLAEQNQKVMKEFYSVLKDLDGSLRFVFITGVSRFAKVSIFSDLNNLNDITLKKQYNTLVGYTEEEIKLHFHDRIQLLMRDENLNYDEVIEKMRLWYNGYNWLGKDKLYNPFGVLNLFDGLRFANYWFATATPSFLINLLKDKVLYNVDDIEIGESVFESFRIEDDYNPISLLFQTGYLTIKKEDTETGLFTLGYPNKEVKVAFMQHLLGAFSGTYAASSATMVVNIKRAFESNSISEVIRLTNVMLKNLPSHIHPNSEPFYHAVLHLTFYYLGIFIESEVNMSDARADAIVKTGTHIYCFEFKYDQSAEEAMQQIKDKGYLEKYGAEHKDLIGIAVNFSSKQKKIDNWLMEQIG